MPGATGRLAKTAADLPTSCAGERNVAFDAARGAALLMVVMFHTATLPISDVDGELSVCRMALLLLISGALSQSLSQAPERARSRGSNLAWLVLVWTPITMLPTHGVTGLWRLPKQLIAPNSHLWYIYLLATLTLLAPSLRRVPPVVLLTVTGAAALAHGAGFRTGVLGWDQCLHYTVFFYIGLHGKPAIDRLLFSIDRSVGVALLATGVLLHLLPVPPYLVTLASAAVLLGLCRAFWDTMPIRGLAWFGRRTADVYLPHMALLWAMLPLLSSLLGRLNWLLVLATATFTIAICLAFRVLADSMGATWLYAIPDWSAARLRIRRMVSAMQPIPLTLRA